VIVPYLPCDFDVLLWCRRMWLVSVVVGVDRQIGLPHCTREQSEKGRNPYFCSNEGRRDLRLESNQLGLNFQDLNQVFQGQDSSVELDCCAASDNDRVN